MGVFCQVDTFYCYKKMKKREIKKGEVFNKLTVIKEVGKSVTEGGRNLRRFLCLCECGKTKVVQQWHLTSGKTKSCSCIRGSHGKWGTPEYKIWAAIVQRCENENNSRFKDYGGRGIMMSKSWRKSFTIFLDDMGKRNSNKHSIERIDNDGNYCKENCVWATKEQQYSNMRNTVRILYKGKNRTLRELSNITGIKPYTIHTRLRRGWSVTRAINQPLEKHRQR